MIDESVQEKVIKTLNIDVGNVVKDLSKCADLVKKLKEDRENIEQKIVKASTIVSSEETSHEIDNVSHTIDVLTEEFKKLCQTAEKNDITKDKKLSYMQEHIKKIQELEQAIAYLKCVRSINDSSHNMKSLLFTRSETEVITEFNQLCQMSTRLHGSNCVHLITYLTNTLHHWHNVLKDRFSLQLDEVLKSAGWPRVNSTVFVTPTPDVMAKFQLIVKHLINIQLPPELSPTPAVTSSLLGNFPPLSLPIALLLKPFKKRFIYHFCGNKQTNRPDKPEWFMTQILTWIRDNEHFITQWVQPVFKQTNRTQITAKMEFIQGLVQLVVDKLHSDLPALMFDDALFSHTVDETLGFDRELKDCTGYLDTLPSAVTVLTQAQVFVKWIHMERKYARDKMDTILGSENAWTELGGSDDLKVTEAAEAFLTLLSTMTERYSILPQPGHRLQFVELQLELVDELRVRLLQLLHSERQDPLDSQLPAILNTASYISTALSEWGTNPHFLMLQHYKSQLETTGVEVSAMQAASLQQGTVFDQALTLLHHLIQELVDVLCEAVMLEVKARSRSYRRDKWFAMTCESTLTPSACPMFQVLVAKLHTLQSLLAAPLFSSAWQSIATQLCTFLLEELVLQNRFNDGGAKQLEQDLTRSLIPLFHQYTQRPEAYFLPLKEACSLLNVRPLPSDWAAGNYNKLPVEIHNLTTEMIHKVIQRRADVIPDLI